MAYVVETQPGSHPPAHPLDSLVRLRHTASAHDERVLAFRDGIQADIDACIFRSLHELDDLADQYFTCAVEDHGRREASQIGV